MSQIRHAQRQTKNLKDLPIVGPIPKSEKEEKHLREIGKYEFYNLEEPGLALKFPYGNHKTQHTFTLFHGGKYDLPRFVARHLESCTTPIWDWRPDGMGRMEKKLVGHKPRFQLRHVYEG